LREREREIRMGWGKLGEQGQCQELTPSKSWHQILGKKMLLTKKAQERTHIQEQGLMAGMR
jgi:hypothetical protein